MVTRAAAAGMRVADLATYRSRDDAIGPGLVLGYANVVFCVLVLIAAAIKLDDRGPVFHRQPRIGRGGQPFVVLKFRSMLVTGASADRLTQAPPPIKGRQRGAHRNDDGSQGWAGYKVADHVKTHRLYGGGVYVFNQNNPSIHTENGFEVPQTPGVRLHHVMTVNLGAGTIDHVVNGVGDAADDLLIAWRDERVAGFSQHEGERFGPFGVAAAHGGAGGDRQGAAPPDLDVPA